MAGRVWKAGGEGCGVSRPVDLRVVVDVCRVGGDAVFNVVNRQVLRDEQHVEGDAVAGGPGPADQVERVGR